MRKNQIVLFLGLLFPVFLHLGCAATQKELRLGATDEDFLTRVRCIVTREEAKIFLEFPPQARSGFIEEFWKRRDSIPKTERNEYQEVTFSCALLYPSKKLSSDLKEKSCGPN